MNINDILKRLKYKDEYKSLVLNAPGEYEEAVKNLGLRPVSQIAIDETWSALRFRPVERVRKK